jgi:hypothetical protein
MDVGERFFSLLSLQLPDSPNEQKPRSGRVGTRPDGASLLGKRLAKDDLTVHRDGREDQRQSLAVAMRPCGPDFCPEAVVALFGDVPCLEGGRLGFGLVTVLRWPPISLCHLGLESERADAAQI